MNKCTQNKLNFKLLKNNSEYILNSIAIFIKIREKHCYVICVLLKILQSLLIYSVWIIIIFFYNNQNVVKFFQQTQKN